MQVKLKSCGQRCNTCGIIVMSCCKRYFLNSIRCGLRDQVDTMLRNSLFPWCYEVTSLGVRYRQRFQVPHLRKTSLLLAAWYQLFHGQTVCGRPAVIGCLSNSTVRKPLK